MAAVSMENGPTTLDAARKKAFLAAWLGWAFDGLDGFLYTLVAIPLVKDLLGAGASPGQVTFTAGLVQGIFLIGWAVGGILFGRLGDTLGRTRTLTLTIVTYAVFTGMTFFAQTWWQLAILRFLAALGIGGEWAAGSALVSETLPKRYRHFASAVLQSGYMMGIILAALTVGALGSLDYRWVFVVGVIPAFFTIWIRRAVPEPEEWEASSKAREKAPVSALFRGEVSRNTWLTLILASVTLTTVWGLLYFITQLVRSLPEVRTLPPGEVNALIRNFTIEYMLWNIAGNFVAAYLAKFIGYRKAIFLLLLGGLTVYTVGFKPGHTLDQIRVAMALAGLTGLGVFGVFPTYIPPLFPTMLRTTGAGFCYNIGRVVAGVGTIWLAMQSAGAVSPNRAIFFLGLLYIPGLVVALLMPEIDARHKRGIDD
ncbi:MAG: MFS transporter [Fimbriimonas sp.]